MAKSDMYLVEPPSIARTRSGKADSGYVSEMSSRIAPGVWVTNTVEYESRKEASNDANVYRRALSIAQGEDQHKYTTKVWGVKDDGTATLNAGDQATWHFAITFDPSRSKRNYTPRKAHSEA